MYRRDDPDDTRCGQLLSGGWASAYTDIARGRRRKRAKSRFVAWWDRG